MLLSHQIADQEVHQEDCGVLLRSASFCIFLMFLAICDSWAFRPDSDIFCTEFRVDLEFLAIGFESRLTRENLFENGVFGTRQEFEEPCQDRESVRVSISIQRPVNDQLV